MTSPHTVALLLIVVVTLFSGWVLACAALDKIPHSVTGALVSASFGGLAGLATVVITEGAFRLVEFALAIGWPFLAFLVFGIVSAAAWNIRAQTPPKLSDVLRKRATMREFLRAHAPLFIVQHVSAFLATWLTATLVVGVAEIRDFALGRLDHALRVVGL